VSWEGRIFSKWDHEFESAFLQQRVSCELDLGRYAKGDRCSAAGPATCAAYAPGYQRRSGKSQRAPPYRPLGPDFRSPVMRPLLLSSYPVSPFDALKRLINSDREFQQARRSHDLTTLMSYYRQNRRPVAVFVDTIDEYFEGYVDSGNPHEADASYLHRNKDSRI
jgi:hypothetical protein